MEVVASNSPIEIEARAWLNAHKEETGRSWNDIGKLADVNGNTLSTFASGKYGGDNAGIATKVVTYRDSLKAQEELADDLPQAPSWYDTPTSRRVLRTLSWARQGKVVVIVGAPGIGKSKAARRYEATNPNVWMATMSPSTAGVATMAIEVASACGLGEIKGSPQQLSRQVKSRVQGRNGLIIVDEAQELTDKALNELRGWHDATGVGLALLGNETVVGQLDTRESALAQIKSRVSLPMVQPMPLPGDIDVALDAWGITDAQQRSFLTRLASIPGAGALRELTHTVELAISISFDAEQPLSLDLLRGAAKQRNVKMAGL